MIEIQAIWHRADQFTREEAAGWCLEHGFKADVYRTRRQDGQVTHHIHAQFDPSLGKEGTWGVLSDDFPEGISASTCERSKAMSLIYAKGHQSADDALEFVMSDETVDRVGDVIVAKGWDLTEFKKNPIALFGHSHRDVIGTWDSVKVKGKQLIGRLRFAEKGTSAVVDTVRSLVEQRILKSVSVGFQPTEMAPILDDEGRHTGGYRFIKSELHECSIVSVPCNPNALATAKSLGADRELLKSIFSDLDPGHSAAPKDPVAEARKTGIALAKLNHSLNHIGEFHEHREEN